MEFRAVKQRCLEIGIDKPRIEIFFGARIRHNIVRFFRWRDPIPLLLTRVQRLIQVTVNVDLHDNPRVLRTANTAKAAAIGMLCPPGNLTLMPAGRSMPVMRFVTRPAFRIFVRMCQLRNFHRLCPVTYRADPMLLTRRFLRCRPVDDPTAERMLRFPGDLALMPAGRSMPVMRPVARPAFCIPVPRFRHHLLCLQNHAANRAMTSFRLALNKTGCRNRRIRHRRVSRLRHYQLCL